MQGLWKDKRKHVIKDKSKGLWNREIRKVMYDNTGEETSKVFTRDVVVMKITKTYKYKTYLCHINLDGKFYIALKKDYNGGDYALFDYFSGKQLTLVRNIYIYGKKHEDMLSLIIHSQELLEVNSVDSISYRDYDTNYMLYGKPFNVREIVNNNHGHRKRAQKEVQNSNRMLQRNYLKKGDFEKDIPIHSCTKSINWMID